MGGSVFRRIAFSFVFAFLLGLEVVLDGLGEGPCHAVGPDGIPRVMWSDLRNGASQEVVFVRSRHTS